MVLVGASPFDIVRVRTIVPVASSLDFTSHENIEPWVGTGSIAPSDVVVGAPVIEEAKIVVLVVLKVVVAKLSKSSLTEAVFAIKLVVKPLIVTSLVLVGAEPFEIVRVRTIVPTASSLDFTSHENIEPWVGIGSIAPIDSDVAVPVIEEGKIIVFIVVRAVV